MMVPTGMFIICPKQRSGVLTAMNTIATSDLQETATASSRRTRPMITNIPTTPPATALADIADAISDIITNRSNDQRKAVVEAQSLVRTSRKSFAPDENCGPNVPQSEPSSAG